MNAAVTLCVRQSFKAYCLRASNSAISELKARLLELHALWLKLNWYGASSLIWWYADTILVTLRQW
jgi:hypothetical protein